MSADSSFFRHSSGAIRGFADQDRGPQSRSRFISLFQSLLDFLRVSSLYEVNRTSSEPPARHSRAVHAFLAIRQLNHQIKLQCADLEIVAKAAMGVRHQPTELSNIAHL